MLPRVIVVLLRCLLDLAKTRVVIAPHRERQIVVGAASGHEEVSFAADRDGCERHHIVFDGQCAFADRCVLAAVPIGFEPCDEGLGFVRSEQFLDSAFGKRGAANLRVRIW